MMADHLQHLAGHAKASSMPMGVLSTVPITATSVPAQCPVPEK